MLLGIATSGLLLLTVQGGTEETHAQQATTDRPVTLIPQEIDPALRNSQAHLANPNVLVMPADETLSLRQKHAQEVLATARRQRAEKQIDSAHTNLVSLLESDAPAEVQRSARLELALLLQDQGELSKAQQLYAKYLKLYPEDPSVPEVILRQGLVYRQMGAPEMAISKFFAVLSSALNLKLDRVEYYQHLVLLAQSEIADTYYLQGNYAEASGFLLRLLRLNDPALDEALVRAKLIRSLFKMDKHADAVAQAELFLKRTPKSGETPDIRYLMSDSLRKLGRNHESVQQMLILLKSQQEVAAKNPVEWVQWQRRAGNDLANQLYSQGDYLNALEIYSRLVELDHAAEWELPVWYQIGLVYERLEQPAKAGDAYGRILARAKELSAESLSPNLTTVVDMARWRSEHLQWLNRVEADRRQLLPPKPDGTEKAPLAAAK